MRPDPLDFDTRVADQSSYENGTSQIAESAVSFSYAPLRERMINSAV
jgi:hypothetical protein